MPQGRFTGSLCAADRFSWFATLLRQECLARVNKSPHTNHFDHLDEKDHGPGAGSALGAWSARNYDHGRTSNSPRCEDGRPV